MSDESDESPQAKRLKEPATIGDLDRSFFSLLEAVAGQWEVITYLLEYLVRTGLVSAPHLQSTLEADLLFAPGGKAGQPADARIEKLRELLETLRAMHAATLPRGPSRH